MILACNCDVWVWVRVISQIPLPLISVLFKASLMKKPPSLDELEARFWSSRSWMSNSDPHLLWFALFALLRFYQSPSPAAPFMICSSLFNFGYGLIYVMVIQFMVCNAWDSIVDFASLVWICLQLWLCSWLLLNFNSSLLSFILFDYVGYCCRTMRWFERGWLLLIVVLWLLELSASLSHSSIVWILVIIVV